MIEYFLLNSNEIHLLNYRELINVAMYLKCYNQQPKNILILIVINELKKFNNLDLKFNLNYSKIGLLSLQNFYKNIEKENQSKPILIKKKKKIKEGSQIKCIIDVNAPEIFTKYNKDIFIFIKSYTEKTAIIVAIQNNLEVCQYECNINLLRKKNNYNGFNKPIKYNLKPEHLSILENNQLNKSEKIRALFKRGVPKSVIGRCLKLKYVYVYKILYADKLRGSSVVERKIHNLKVAGSIPAPATKKM